MLVRLTAEGEASRFAFRQPRGASRSLPSVSSRALRQARNGSACGGGFGAKPSDLPKVSDSRPTYFSDLPRTAREVITRSASVAWVGQALRGWAGHVTIQHPNPTSTRVLLLYSKITVRQGHDRQRRSRGGLHLSLKDCSLMVNR